MALQLTTEPGPNPRVLSMSQLVIATVGVACLIAVALVPMARALFRVCGIVDSPDRERKLHRTAIPLGGGLAVFLAVGFSFAIVLSVDRYLGQGLLGNLNSQWYTLFSAAALLLLVGLIDDAIALRGRQKLLLQILVVVTLVGGGTLMQSIHLFGQQVDLGIFAYPLTVLWLLAAINAVNLLDGADGVASTAGAIISLALAILCVQSGQPLGAVAAAGLAGALLGFLCYNRPPASIYLGDAGSMVIGLFIGVISIWSSLKQSTLLSVAPLVVLTVPLFDSTIAILRRLLTGRSLYAADRGHLHHRLLDRFTHPVMLVAVAVLCALSSGAAILSFHLGQQWIALAGVGLVLGLLVFTRSFGNAELRMLASRTSYFGESLLVRRDRGNHLVHHRSVQLQGDRCWDTLWMSLVEFADDRGLYQIKLDVGIAWMQEGYHGSWRRAKMPEKAEQATVKLPLFVDKRLVGRLEAIGDARVANIGDTLQLLIERAEDLDWQIQRLLAGDAPGSAPAASPDASPNVAAASSAAAAPRLSPPGPAHASPVHAAAADATTTGVPPVTAEHTALALSPDAPGSAR